MFAIYTMSVLKKNGHEVSYSKNIPNNFINYDMFFIDKVYLSSALVVYAGIMMISRVPTPSAKNIKLSPLYMRLITILVIVILIFLIECG